MKYDGFVRAGALRQLIADGKGWQDRPEFFGDPGYNSESRLAAAGLTFEQLHAAGFGIQASLHTDYVTGIMEKVQGEDPSQKAMRERRRQSYKAQHGGLSGDARVTSVSCPSGLRPKSVPEAARAAHLIAWHTNLISRLGTLPDDAPVQADPLAIGEGASLAAANEKARDAGSSTPKSTNPKGYIQIINLLSQAKTCTTGAIGLLRDCDMPDAAQATLLEFVEWDAMMPDFSKAIMPAWFDDVTVRIGARVTIAPDSVSLNVVKALANKAGLGSTDLTALAFEVKELKMVGDKPAAWVVHNESLGRNITVAMGQLRRIPKTPKVIATKIWTPQIGGMAVLGDRDVIVHSISAEGKAMVEFLDPQHDETDEPFETTVTNLKETA